MSVVPLESPAHDPRAALSDRLAELHERLENAAARCRARSDDEAIHDLRVTARRLESVLDVWRGALRDGPRRRARDLLRQLRRRAGRAREREVSAALLTDRLAHGEGEPAPSLVALIAELRPRVAKSRDEVAALASIARMRKLGRRIERAVERRERVSDPQAGHAIARARLERRRHQALERLISARGTPTDAALHAARIAVKKWRYAEESFAGVAGAPPQPARGLRQLQTRLGDVHDAAVLRDLLLEWADRWRERDRGAEAAALAAVAAEIESERSARAQQFCDTGDFAG